ncbi:hypothetical protein CCHL11_00939 [Colletotrichum chlorophyti]|uniref:Uncharacterized protein n=1 Tax=Colletotrichum chlorophyti TaxID=708187 RepID=A0A1Q8S8B6_9PEZI|nr:hypothetical protein CCHL11_00939 [Colletotrichum chlorophyti]
MSDEDPGPAAYALAHDLFVDSQIHFTSGPKLSASLPLQLALISSDINLDNSDSLVSLVIPDPIFPPERDVKEEALDDVLEKLIGASCKEKLMELALESSEPQSRICQAAPKLELPSLRSDLRHDLKALARTVAGARLDDFFRNPSTLPLEPVDEREDEGLALPISAVHCHDQLARDAELGELDYSEEDLTYIAESIHADLTDEDLRRLGRAATMTPPLVGPPFLNSNERENFTSNNGVCAVETFSEPESLLAADVAQVEKHLDDLYGDEHQQDLPTSDILGIPSGTLSPEIFTSHCNNGDLMMEPPLLPMLYEETSKLEQEDTCRALIGGVATLYKHSEFEQGVDLSFVEDESSFNEQFCLLLKDKADQMMRRAEQEQIEIVDAIVRLQPPVLNFTHSEPDWQKVAGDASAMFRWICRRYQEHFKPAWWPRSRHEQKELRWIPFPTSLGKIDVAETVGDNRTLRQLFGGIGSAALPTSANYVRTERRLKILSLDDGDEELPILPSDNFFALSMHTPVEGLMELIRKRKIADAEEMSASIASPTVGVRSRQTTNHYTTNENLTHGLLLGEGETNAAGRLLSNYMDLRAAKRSKSASRFFPTPEKTTTTKPGPGGSIRHSHRPQSKPVPQPPIRVLGSDTPCLPIENLEEAPRIIISVDLPRYIISALRTKFSGIDLVDRDFTRHNTLAWSPGSAQRVEVVSPLFFEADIIPSPATGLILTNLLKVCQKALPGSKTQTSKLRERLVKVAPLYERVIVLVSDANPTGEQTRPLKDSETEAYASFVAFASSLGHHIGNTVTVMYVPGGTQTLANWTCALVSAHAREASSEVQQIIMSEETEWEVFLRRAGLNMYAAQVALAVAKDSQAGVSGDAALMRFLRMGAEQRAHILGGHLGGRRGLVDRVSARLG